MVSQKVVIKNPTGLHLRPAGILCKEAMKFKSLITFSINVCCFSNSGKCCPITSIKTGI